MVGYSQDAWIFQKNNDQIVPLELLEKMNFTIGNCPGCDGYNSYLLKKYFKNVWNWAAKFKILHYDRCRGHAFGDMILNEHTDLSIRKYLAENKVIRDQCFTCPFINYPNTNNQQTCCGKENPHIHKNHIIENVSMQEMTLIVKQRLDAMQSPDITEKEKKNTLAHCQRMIQQYHLKI